MKESTLRAYIDKLSATREELKELVVGATDTGSDCWILVLEQELMWVQTSMASMDCRIHSTCLHFGLQGRGETYEEWMVMALDGTQVRSRIVASKDCYLVESKQGPWPGSKVDIEDIRSVSTDNGQS